MTMTTKISLGQGVLTWDREERVSNRYGTVYIAREGCNSLTPGRFPSLVDGDAAATVAGQYGKLVAEVIEARKSTHIGDHARQIYPETPEVGERIALGDGSLFTESTPAGGLRVGLRPTGNGANPDRDMFVFANGDEGYFQTKKPGKDKDWLNPRALYRAHEQTVRLIFEPSLN